MKALVWYPEIQHVFFIEKRHEGSCSLPVDLKPP